MKFGAGSLMPKRGLKFWSPSRDVPAALVQVCSDRRFDRLARRHGRDPAGLAGFTVRATWYRRGRIYLRRDQLDKFPHEWRHHEGAFTGDFHFHD